MEKTPAAPADFSTETMNLLADTRRHSFLHSVLFGQGLKRLLFALSILAVAWVLAGQYHAPNKRTLEALGGVLFLVYAINFDVGYSLMLLFFLIPYPFSMTVGDTNTIFIFVLFIIWASKLSIGNRRYAGRTPIDFLLLFFLLCHILSFSNMADRIIEAGLINLRVFISCLVLYLLCVNLIRSPRTLKQAIYAVGISVASVMAISLGEIFSPEATRRALSFLHLEAATVREGAARTKGIFGDYETLSEYLAVTIPIALFMFQREKNIAAKVFWGSLAGVEAFVLMSTATRGGFIALWAGLMVMFFFGGHIFNRKKMMTAGVVLLVLMVVSSMFLVAFTDAGRMFDRLANTKFEGGIPDTRVRVWSHAWMRIWEYPILGHGPHYELGWGEDPLYKQYPHSGYLFYAHMIGFLGVGVFIVFLGRLFIMMWHASRTKLPVKRSFVRDFSVIMLTSLTAFAVSEMKIGYLRYHRYQHFIWMLFGLAGATWMMARDEKRHYDREMAKLALSHGQDAVPEATGPGGGLSLSLPRGGFRRRTAPGRSPGRRPPGSGRARPAWPPSRPGSGPGSPAG
jgi:hypothetical protein